MEFTSMMFGFGVTILSIVGIGFTAGIRLGKMEEAIRNLQENSKVHLTCKNFEPK